ncbi:Xaa-Pro peptidase family protein [Patulibacter sp. NPDC049589]|uniref:M24 family metallopeptidase n=1 Tax=Patulibacter sp. NPDC049589 TaxID=3154731 RepID=UPI003437BE30
MSTEHEDRWRRAQDALRARGLDGLLVWSRGGGALDGFFDVFYLSGHYTYWPLMPDIPLPGSVPGAGRSHAAFVLPADGEPTLVVDVPDWRRDRVGVADVRYATDLPRVVAEVLAERDLRGGALGLAGGDVIVASLDRRVRTLLAGTTLVAADDLLQRLRYLKSPAELDALRHAGEVGTTVVDAILERALRPGTREREAVAAGFAAGVAGGAVLWDALVSSGPHSHELAHGRLPSWTDRTIERGDLFHLDCVGMVDGYLFDVARTVVVGGRPDDRQLRLLEGVLGAVEAGAATVGDGVASRDVYSVVRGGLAEAGLVGADGEPTFGYPGSYSHGHGLGLATDEPFLLPDVSWTLEPGICLTVEAMAGHEGVGSAVFEHDLVITTDGVEVLDGSPTRHW